MDSRGWIEIDLLASFNRVKQLTSDHQLVREVLMLSTLVQVREGYVRMGGWERFVLPDAVKSAVEGGDGNDLEDLRLQQQQEYPTPSSYDLQSSSSVGDLEVGKRRRAIVFQVLLHHHKIPSSGIISIVVAVVVQERKNLSMLKRRKMKMMLCL